MQRLKYKGNKKIPLDLQSRNCFKFLRGWIAPLGIDVVGYVTDTIVTHNKLKAALKEICAEIYAEIKHHNRPQEGNITPDYQRQNR